MGQSLKDRELYVWCANASDGILTAHPTNKGRDLSEIEGKHGAPFGQEIMQNAAESGIRTEHGGCQCHADPQQHHDDGNRNPYANRTVTMTTNATASPTSWLRTIPAA